MKKIKICLPGGDELFLGVPDEAKILGATSRGSEQKKPSSSKGNSKSPQKILYLELKEFCNGDYDRMEEIMRKISEWKKKSKTVREIPSLSDGRAGAALKNLRELKKNPPQESSDNFFDQDDPFSDHPDDDVPF